jgi:hypothetical protein
MNDFSIAVERTAMEKHSAAFAAREASFYNKYRHMVIHSVDPLGEGLCHFAFRRLSEKQNKKTTTLRSPRLLTFIR